MSHQSKRLLSNEKVCRCVKDLHTLKTFKRRLLFQIQQHEQEILTIKNSVKLCEDRIDSIELDLNDAIRKARTC